MSEISRILMWEVVIIMPSSLTEADWTMHSSSSCRGELPLNIYQGIGYIYTKYRSISHSSA